jgi:hypothetical protein
MKRVVAVLLAAALMADVFGLSDTSLAREPQAAPGAQTPRPEVVKRLGQIPIKSVVKIERTDGTKLNAYLEEVTPDTITVAVLEKDSQRRETIPVADIKKIEEVRGHALRNVLIGVGIGVAVVFGACAVAISQDTTKPAVVAGAESGPSGH